MLNIFHKLFKTTQYKKSQQINRLLALETLKKDLISPSKGIVNNSLHLYNFLKESYEPFSLKKYDSIRGVKLTVYANNSTALLAFIDKAFMFKEAQYAATVKSFSDLFKPELIYFGDWYDNDENIADLIELTIIVLEVFIFYNGQVDLKEETLITDREYSDLCSRMKLYDKRYQGLYDFVNHKDYRVLVGEIINVLIALHEVNLRSLGETTE